MKSFFFWGVFFSWVTPMAFQDAPRPSSLDCTWRWIEQPLDHFARGVTPGGNATYRQRYCIYSHFLEKRYAGPLFFYTGNESPVEVYVNNTGLMWELGARMGALLVFAEHRYFGLSFPQLKGVPNCGAYLSSSQALEDFAALISSLRSEFGQIGGVVAFGGSYGGMLSAWLRLKYPHQVDGAIAASAPIWGFPLTYPVPDGAYQVITSAAGKECSYLLNVAWPLISDIATTSAGQEWLSETLNLCSPVKSSSDVSALLQYLQTPYFLLSEGQYAFASNYLTFATLGKSHPLPPWPLTVACSHVVGSTDVRVDGELSAVKYKITIGKVVVSVNWDKTHNNGYSLKDVANSGIGKLIRGVADAAAVWYNVSGDQGCHAWQSTPQMKASLLQGGHGSRNGGIPVGMPSKPKDENSANSNECTVSDIPDGWGVMCCNEGLNLIIDAIRGAGRDMFWPPSSPKGTTLADLLGSPGPNQCAAQYAAQGLHGLSTRSDPWSHWEDTYYGGLRIDSISNVVFSNGLLDPWSAGGVLQNISSTAVAITIPLGGHHADLFFSTPDDPSCVREARAKEEEYIRRWVQSKGEPHQIPIVMKAGTTPDKIPTGPKVDALE